MHHPEPSLPLMSKVLFIDDDPYPSRRARRALEERGFDVTICSEPLEGLRLMKVNGYLN